MVSFTAFGENGLRNWLKARHPDVDFYAFDWEAMWDSSLSVSENFTQITDKLESYGMGKTAYCKKDVADWEAKAEEWYQSEIKQPEYQPEVVDFVAEYVTLYGYGEGFKDDEPVYAMFRPKGEIDYHTLFRLGHRISRLESAFGVI